MTRGTLRATMDVEGMSCANCVRHVTKALGKVAGVSDAKVEIGRVELAFDPAQTSPEAIASALAAAGYPARAAP